MFQRDSEGKLVIPKMPEPSGNAEVNFTYNEHRTYDHLHNNIKIGYPDYTDEDIAHMTRMLMRDDWNHESICVTARDRILCLLKEKEELLETLAFARQHIHFAPDDGSGAIIDLIEVVLSKLTRQPDVPKQESEL